MHRFTLPLVILLVLFVGCGDDGQRGAAGGRVDTAPSTTSTTVAGTTSCDADRYQVAYPAGWSTNAGTVVPACRFFNPEPFTVPPATEFFDVAVVFDVEAVPFPSLVEGVGGVEEEVIARSDVTISGHPGLRVEARATGSSLVPSGTPSLRYLVDLDGATLVTATYGLPGSDHIRNREVLEAMMASLELKEEAPCSAGGVTPPPPLTGLPPPVAEMRQAIIEAAIACDFERLAVLARPGAFTYSFGASGDPASYWRQEEEHADPLRMLVHLLDRPFTTRIAGDSTQYLWPRAYGYQAWSDVPPEAKDELEPLYGPADFERFARFGSYAGARVGIDGTGDWLFFVAGD